ncbi:hypothetical protein Pcinc_035502 [Petrolisthes cinctipes]|uniref:Uncharacterized protein n=1 Tax=Petrolisthes cinctipes TaxID=88211 RepID=A0AAE1BZS3_PETCI|nr:hypothetical protein Pcinc_035502 [Petrolisthes cinctipes]
MEDDCTRPQRSCSSTPTKHLKPDCTGRKCFTYLMTPMDHTTSSQGEEGRGPHTPVLSAMKTGPPTPHR